jgi:hypothetical protein
MTEHYNALFRRNDFVGREYPSVGRFSSAEVREYCGGGICPVWAGCPPSLLEKIMTRNAEKRTRSFVVEARKRAERISADIAADERKNPKVLTNADLIKRSKEIALQIAADELKTAEQNRHEEVSRWQAGKIYPWQ